MEHRYKYIIIVLSIVGVIAVVLMLYFFVFNKDSSKNLNFGTITITDANSNAGGVYFIGNTLNVMFSDHVSHKVNWDYTIDGIKWTNIPNDKAGYNNISFIPKTLSDKYQVRITDGSRKGISKVFSVIPSFLQTSGLGDKTGTFVEETVEASIITVCDYSNSDITSLPFTKNVSDWTMSTSIDSTTYTNVSSDELSNITILQDTAKKTYTISLTWRPGNDSTLVSNSVYWKLTTTNFVTTGLLGEVETFSNSSFIVKTAPTETDSIYVIYNKSPTTSVDSGEAILLVWTVNDADTFTGNVVWSYSFVSEGSQFTEFVIDAPAQIAKNAQVQSTLAPSGWGSVIIKGIKDNSISKTETITVSPEVNLSFTGTEVQCYPKDAPAQHYVHFDYLSTDSANTIPSADWTITFTTTLPTKTPTIAPPQTTYIYNDTSNSQIRWAVDQETLIFKDGSAKYYVNVGWTNDSKLPFKQYWSTKLITFTKAEFSMTHGPLYRDFGTGKSSITQVLRCTTDATHGKTAIEVPCASVSESTVPAMAACEKLWNCASGTGKNSDLDFTVLPTLNRDVKLYNYEEEYVNPKGKYKKFPDEWVSFSSPSDVVKASPNFVMFDFDTKGGRALTFEQTTNDKTRFNVSWQNTTSKLCLAPNENVTQASETCNFGTTGASGSGWYYNFT